MKILTTILKGLLAVWFITGALYMMSNYSMLASEWAFSTLPAWSWILLGLVQLVAAAVLLGAAFLKNLQPHAGTAAIILAIISLAGLFLYSAYAGLPGLLWALIPAALLFWVAYQSKLQLVN